MNIPRRGCRLVWSRLVASGAIDPGSNPGSPILEALFCVGIWFCVFWWFESWLISCFRWFSNVLLRLKPSSFDFSINSLFRYNTTFLFRFTALASRGCEWTSNDTCLVIETVESTKAREQVFLFFCLLQITRQLLVQLSNLMLFRNRVCPHSCASA